MSLIKEALEQEEISWTRYKSYQQILNGEDDTYRITNHLL